MYRKDRARIRTRAQEAQGYFDTPLSSWNRLYPFPEAELLAEFERHSEARDIVWVQEEPANMGALFYVLPRLRRIAGECGRTVGEAFGQREPGDRIGESA